MGATSMKDGRVCDEGASKRHPRQKKGK